jgi:hypothetical protein
VYELVKNTEWKVTGEGWAQIHLYKYFLHRLLIPGLFHTIPRLCRDESDGTFRIVGWTVKNLQVPSALGLTPDAKLYYLFTGGHQLQRDVGVCLQKEVT